LLVGGQAKQDALHDAEDRGVRANAESKREYRDNRKARIFEKHPDAIFQIVQEAIHSGAFLALSMQMREL